MEFRNHSKKRSKTCEAERTGKQSNVCIHKERTLNNMQMKKYVMILMAIIGLLSSSNLAFSQQRTKIADGLTLVRYGNTAVLEDDKNQMTWNLSVTREQKSTGEWIYYVACGNKYTKTVAKYTLSGAVTAAVRATGIGSFFAGAVGVVASTFYDDVCNYFGDEK
jgi:hypothetical protein